MKKKILDVRIPKEEQEKFQKIVKCFCQKNGELLSNLNKKSDTSMATIQKLCKTTQNTWVPKF